MTCAHRAQRDRGLGSPGPLPTHTQWTGLQAVGTALGGLVATKHWSPHVRLDTDTAKSQGGHCPLNTQPGPDLCPLRPSSGETVVGVSRRCKRRGSRLPSCAEALTGRRTHETEDKGALRELRLTPCKGRALHAGSGMVAGEGPKKYF